MHEIDFLALDCETTGVDSRKDNIIELGAVKFSLAENFASFDSLFHSPTRIPQFIERLTGIQNSDLDGAPKFLEKKTEVENFVGESVLVGHNLPFDIDFLKSAGLDLSLQKTLDTFLLAGLILSRGESLGLETLAQKFGVEHTEAHRALADAEATRDLLRVFISLAQNFSREKWERIRDLDSFEKSWVQFFADLVLNSEIEKREFENTEIKNSEIRESIVEKLFAEFSAEAKLLEISAQPNEILAAAEKLQKPSAIFFVRTTAFAGISSAARELSAELIFAPQDLVDPQKLQKFLAKKLSPTELVFAAKLILHENKNRHEMNLNRVENLLFDFVASEKISKNSNSKIIVGDHAALEFENSDRIKIIVDAASFVENRIRADSFVLDLSNLELLAPAFAEKIQIWWGLLGLLFREVAPQFGRLDFASASGLSNFQKTIEAGQNLLAEISEFLPPRVANFLANFLDIDSNFSKSLRSNLLNEITVVVEPREFASLDFSQNFLVDGALDAADDFFFAKKMFDLPRDFPTAKISENKNSPRFFVAENFPDPAAPQFFPAVQKFLLENLPQFSGRTALIFPNRNEAGNFAERATGELELPIFSRKIPSIEKLHESENAVVVFSVGNFRALAEFQNLVVVKLPFFVREGADFFAETLPATTLRFKKMWASFASSDSAENFFILDSRLLSKKYGQNLLDAIPQKFEGVKISV